MKVYNKYVDFNSLNSKEKALKELKENGVVILRNLESEKKMEKKIGRAHV